MTEEYKIIFVWTAESPRSVDIKNVIQKSPYVNIISLVCADDSKVRNYLLYGKYPQASVPVFIIVRNGVPEFYQLKDEKKVMNKASELLDLLHSEETMTDGTASVARSSVTNLSFPSHMGEDI